MGELKKIAVLDNMVEANVLDSMLNGAHIPPMIKTYHDSAYDGIFQGSKGWGHVESPEEYRTEIMSVLQDLRNRPKENLHNGDEPCPD